MDVADVRTGFTKHKDDIGVRCQKLFQDFLEEFKEGGEYKYLEPMGQLEKMGRNSLEVSFEDVETYNANLATTIVQEYYRVYPYLCQALANIVMDRAKESLDKKEYFVSFVDVSTRHRVRELKSAKIGSLVRISGQVVRTHPVHPELVSGTFMCLECQTVIPNVEQQFKFTIPAICRNPVCNNRRRFELILDKSVFVDFQKAKIQETQAELPRGSIPRGVDIILRAEIVETVQAGGRYDFTGTLIVVPDIAVLSMPGAKAVTGSRHKGGDNAVDGVRGLKSLGVRDLNYRMAFLACSVEPTNSRFCGGELSGEFLTAEMIKKQMTDAEWNKVYEMSRDKNLCSNLVSSLFPSIHGNDQIKKGIILMLFGGVAKKTMEGTALRGDINCIIIGDPSTAKSQLLKQVAELCPRSVYTSGKASTAAGLTAAVVRDEESSDFVIEAGALLLADNGICCIDEFDKMDLHDQVAIHEAMEQQTISLAKAGVRASLNARTSILAAANPVGGRYDRTKSLQRNVTLSAPIMSRFDLFFVLLDECNEVVDYAIAQKIVALHSNLEQVVDKVYTQDEVLRYISFAKQFKPLITPEAKTLLVESYNQLRQRDVQSNSKGTWRISVRQLESLIRLSEAMAKMHCSDDVLRKHVEEAFQLLNKSIIRVEQPDINLDDESENVDVPMSSAPRGIDGEPEDDPDDPAPLNSPPVTPQPASEPKKKLTLSFEEYKRLTNSIVTFIRHDEERKIAEIEESGSDEMYDGIRKSEVINNYLEKVSNEIDNEEELVEKKALFMKVIERLINHDQILIPLTGTHGGTEDEEEQDPFIVVHPRYAPDV